MDHGLSLVADLLRVEPLEITVELVATSSAAAAAAAPTEADDEPPFVNPTTGVPMQYPRPWPPLAEPAPPPLTVLAYRALARGAQLYCEEESRQVKALLESSESSALSGDALAVHIRHRTVEAAGLWAKAARDITGTLPKDRPRRHCHVLKDSPEDNVPAREISARITEMHSLCHESGEYKRCYSVRLKLPRLAPALLDCRHDSKLLDDMKARKKLSRRLSHGLGALTQEAKLGELEPRVRSRFARRQRLAAERSMDSNDDYTLLTADEAAEASKYLAERLKLVCCPRERTHTPASRFAPLWCSCLLSGLAD